MLFVVALVGIFIWFFRVQNNFIMGIHQRLAKCETDIEEMKKVDNRIEVWREDSIKQIVVNEP